MVKFSSIKSPRMEECRAIRSCLVYSVGMGIAPSLRGFHMRRYFISCPTCLTPRILLGKSVSFGVTIGLENLMGFGTEAIFRSPKGISACPSTLARFLVGAVDPLLRRLRGAFDLSASSSEPSCLRSSSSLVLGFVSLLTAFLIRPGFFVGGFLFGLASLGAKPLG